MNKITDQIEEQDETTNSECSYSKSTARPKYSTLNFAQLTGTVEYTDCTSAEG